MDRAKIILRMKRISENMLRAYKWIAFEIISPGGPSKEAIAFSEEIESVLNKYEVDKRGQAAGTWWVKNGIRI